LSLNYFATAPRGRSPTWHVFQTAAVAAMCKSVVAIVASFWDLTSSTWARSLSSQVKRQSHVTLSLSSWALHSPSRNLSTSTLGAVAAMCPSHCTGTFFTQPRLRRCASRIARAKRPHSRSCWRQLHSHGCARQLSDQARVTSTVVEGKSLAPLPPLSASSSWASKEEDATYSTMKQKAYNALSEWLSNIQAGGGPNVETAEPDSHVTEHIG
jgi:hypothetical protein